MPEVLPPLVAPGPPLAAEDRRRYARQIILDGFGETAQRRMLAARVLVVGAGGLGAPVLQYLAAAGVGTIGIVDADHVELDNLHRQVVHSTGDLGRPKVESARDRLIAINPTITVRAHHGRLTADNALQLFAGYDLVVDGSDNFPTRYLVNDACVLLGLPLVWGSVLGFEGQVSVFWAAHGPHYRDVFPEPPPPGSVPSCAENGVIGALCGVIGSLMATEAVKLICGIGPSLLGRLLVHDALSGTSRTLGVRPDPDARAITALAPAAPAARMVEPDELRRRLAAGDDLLLVDVRTAAEHAQGRIPGSALHPLGELTDPAVQRELAAAAEVVLYCRSGLRSAEGAALLSAAGLTGITQLAGGFQAWTAAESGR